MGRHHVRKPAFVPVRVPQLRFKTMLATVTTPFAAMGVYAQLTTVGAAVVVGAVAIPAMTVDVPPVEPHPVIVATEPASRFPLPYVRLPKAFVEVAQIDPLPVLDGRVAEINKRPSRVRTVRVEHRTEPAPRVGRHRAPEPCPPGRTPPATGEPTTPSEGGTGTPAASGDTTSLPGASHPHPVRDLVRNIVAKVKSSHTDSSGQSDSNRGRSDKRGHGDQDRGHSGGDREGGGHRSGGHSSSHSSSHGGKDK